MKLPVSHFLNSNEATFSPVGGSLQPSNNLRSSDLVNHRNIKPHNFVKVPCQACDAWPDQVFVAALVPQDPSLLAEYEELADAIVFWEAAAARANSPAALAYAQHTLVRLKDKADRLIQEIEEC
jgi:hypothetical protein